MAEGLAKEYAMDKDSFHVLARRKFSDHPDDNYLQFVLCLLPHNPLTPFVTWLENASGVKRFFVEGHYFEELFQAIDDFNTRR